MVGVVTACARRAALDDADESGAAAATVACLLGMAGAPWLTLPTPNPNPNSNPDPNPNPKPNPYPYPLPFTLTLTLTRCAMAHPVGVRAGGERRAGGRPRASVARLYREQAGGAARRRGAAALAVSGVALLVGTG